MDAPIADGGTQSRPERAGRRREESIGQSRTPCLACRNVGRVHGPEGLRSRLHEVVRALASDGPAGLARVGVSLAYAELDLFTAVRDYGPEASRVVLVPLPADAWDHPGVGAVQSDHGSWAVDIALVVDDIHVL